MRILKPEVAKNRKRQILNWVVYNYVNTGRPVSSDLIASEASLKVSSATIRNILKELEAEGYLSQPHTSGGRVPTDKGYRAYVNSILRMQKLASMEKERIEHDYKRKVEQLDGFLRYTSRMLAESSQCAGFVMSSDADVDSIKRIELLSIGPRRILSIIFTQAGIIKNVTFNLKESTEKIMVKAVAQLLNETLVNVPLAEASGILKTNILPRLEGMPVKDFILKLAEYLTEMGKGEDSLYLNGLSKIYASPDEESLEEVKDVACLLEEKERFSDMLRERIKKSAAAPSDSNSPVPSEHRVDVTIGAENDIKEFKNFSLVSSTYYMNNKAVGMIGILGHKRMEYPRMILLVESVCGLMEEVLSEWEQEGFEDY